MPQQSLLPEVPNMTSLVLEVRSFPHTTDIDTVEVMVRVGLNGRPAGTVLATTFTGIESDYLNTFVDEVTSVYMWGENTRQVARAGADVKRLARKHRATHGL